MIQVMIKPWMKVYNKRWTVTPGGGVNLALFPSIPEAIHYIEEKGYILKPTNI